MTTSPELTVPVVLKAMAQKISTIDGIAAAYYPKPGKIVRWPSVVMLWGGQNAAPTEIEPAVGFKTWTAEVTARLLVATTYEPTREQKRIDDLITPIADLFETWGAGIHAVLPTLPGHVDTLEFIRVANELKTEFGGEECYVADLVFRTRFKRRTRR